MHCNAAEPLARQLQCLHCSRPVHGNSCSPFAGTLPEEWRELTSVQAIQLSINDLSGAFAGCPMSVLAYTSSVTIVGET